MKRKVLDSLVSSECTQCHSDSPRGSAERGATEFSQSSSPRALQRVFICPLPGNHPFWAHRSQGDSLNHEEFPEIGHWAWEMQSLTYSPNHKHKKISKGLAPKQGLSPASLQGPAGAPPGGTGQGLGSLLAFNTEKQAPESQGPWPYPLGTHHAWPGYKTGNLR